jgi:hypothetical protein
MQVRSLFGLLYKVPLEMHYAEWNTYSKTGIMQAYGV